MNTTEIIWNLSYCIGLFLILWGAVVELFSVEETKPTGVTKVLYENNMGITLVKETYHDWVILSSIHTLEKLMNDCGRYICSLCTITCRERTKCIQVNHSVSILDGIQLCSISESLCARKLRECREVHFLHH